MLITGCKQKACDLTYKFNVFTANKVLPDSHAKRHDKMQDVGFLRTKKYPASV